MASLKRFLNRIQPVHVVWLLIGLYVLFFSLNSIRIHNALQTHTADLGQIDLAVWNTSRGRFVQEIKGEQISTRLTDHVEPIWIPISLIYWLWNDVRALLILQTLALAVGAWPLYLLTRRRLKLSDGEYALADFERIRYRERVQGIARSTTAPAPIEEGWGPALLAAIYLLFPALQAANLTEVHAIAFAVPLILFGLWFIDSAQWGKAATSLLLLAMVKEEAALLAAVLGLYGLLRALRRPPAYDSDSPPRSRWRGILLTGAAATIALLWFLAATFVIVPANAADVYQANESTYFLRYGHLGDNAADIARAILYRPDEVWAIASTPGRVQYLLGLFLSTGGLALFGPEILLLSIPILLANLLSTFAAQWSGELHYSAPLVAYFMGAAAFGLNRLARLFSRRRLLRPAITSTRIGLVALIIALSYHIFAGWTPIGLNFRWPAVGPHERMLSRFVDQIPADAPLAATTALVPHVSHREFIYKLPNLGRAEWVLADASGTTDMHAAALQDQIRSLLKAGWGVVDAADGYVLLAKQGGDKLIPNAFYDFARVADPDQIALDQAMQAEWPGGTAYLGYQIDDQPKWGLTRITHYFRTGNVPLSPYLFVAAVDGQVVDDSIQRPPPALQWYGPGRWQSGETLAFSSAWFLPDMWRPGVAFANGSELPSPAADPNQRVVPAKARGEMTWDIQEDALWLQPWRRADRNASLTPLDEEPAVRTERLMPPAGGAAVWLQTAPAPALPGEDISLRLGWFALEPLPQDYTIFVHVLDASGKRLTQDDAPPHHFYPIPTTAWPPQEPIYTGHVLHLPDDLAPGRYQIVVGMYDPASGERVSVVGPDDRATDALAVGSLHVRRGDGVTAKLGR